MILIIIIIFKDKKKKRNKESKKIITRDSLYPYRLRPPLLAARASDAAPPAISWRSDVIIVDVRTYVQTPPAPKRCMRASVTHTKERN